MFGKERDDSASRTSGLISRISPAQQEKVEPRFPIAATADPVKKLVVGIPVRFEVKTEIKYRIAKHRLFAEHERDEETAEAAVAGQERMDRLKLNMHKSCFDQYR